MTMSSNLDIEYVNGIIQNQRWSIIIGQKRDGLGHFEDQDWLLSLRLAKKGQDG